MSSRSTLTPKSLTNDFSQSARNDTAMGYGKPGHRDGDIESRRSSQNGPVNGHGPSPSKRRQEYLSNAGGRGRKPRSLIHSASSPGPSRGGSYHSRQSRPLESGRHPSQNRERTMPNNGVNAAIEWGTKRSLEPHHLDQGLLQSGPSGGAGCRWGRRARSGPTNRSRKPVESVRNGTIPHSGGRHAQVPIPLTEDSAERKPKRLKESQECNPADSQHYFQRIDKPHLSGVGGPPSGPRAKTSALVVKRTGPGASHQAKECSTRVKLGAFDSEFRTYAQVPSSVGKTNGSHDKASNGVDNSLQDQIPLKDCAPEPQNETCLRFNITGGTEGCGPGSPLQRLGSRSSLPQPNDALGGVMLPVVVSGEEPEIPPSRDRSPSECSARSVRSTSHPHTPRRLPRPARDTSETRECHRCHSVSRSASRRNTPSAAEPETRPNVCDKQPRTAESRSTGDEVISQDYSDPTLASELHLSKPADMVDPHPPGTEDPISCNRSGGALTPRFEVVIPASFPSTRNSVFPAASVGSMEGEVLLAPTTVESLQDRVVPPAPSLGAGITLDSLHGGASRQPNTEHAAPGCPPRAALSPSKYNHLITLTEALVPTGSHYAHSTFASDVGHPQRWVEYSCGNGSSVPPPNSRVATIDDKSGAVTAPGWETQTKSECAASIPSQRQHCKQRNPPGNGVPELPPRPPSTTSSPPYSPPPAFPEEVEPRPMHSRPCLPRPVSSGRHDEESKEHRFDVYERCTAKDEKILDSRPPENAGGYTRRAVSPTAPAPKISVPAQSSTEPNSPKQLGELRYGKDRMPLPPIGVPENRAEDTPKEPVQKIKTRRELVAEKYNMKPPELLQPKPSEAHTNLEHKSSQAAKVRTVPDKGAARAVRKTAFLPRKVLATPSQWSPKSVGTERPASKQPSPSATPTRRASGEGTRSTMSMRKTARPYRRQPALKQAGVSIQLEAVRSTSTESGDSGSDGGWPVEATETARVRLQHQKKYTKIHMRRANKISKELECEKRAKAELEEQVQKLQEQLKTLGSAQQSQQGVRNRDIYKDWEFDSNSANPLFLEPEALVSRKASPPPEPAPDYKPREKSWRKTKYVPWDPSRLMNLHVHRQCTPSHQSIAGFSAKLVEPEKEELCATVDGLGEDDLAVKISGMEPTTFDEYVGIPKDAVPQVKDGSLGFKAGVINRRNNLPDRNAPFYKVRAPGDIKSSFFS